MKLKNLKLKRIQGWWRLVEFVPWEKSAEWGNYRIIWPRWHFR